MVDTGNWLVGRKVLISPAALIDSDRDGIFLVNLTKNQVKHSPDIDTKKPVSGAHENLLNEYYSWPGSGIGFLTTGMVGGVISPGISFEDKIAEEMHPQEAKPAYIDKHLRSFKQFTDSKIYAAEEEIGEVNDLLLNQSNWSIPFLVIETGTWYAGKKILSSISSITKMDVENSAVYINQSCDVLRNYPEFDPEKITDADFLASVERLHITS